MHTPAPVRVLRSLSSSSQVQAPQGHLFQLSFPHPHYMACLGKGGRNNITSMAVLSAMAALQTYPLPISSIIRSLIGARAVHVDHLSCSGWWQGCAMHPVHFPDAGPWSILYKSHSQENVSLLYSHPILGHELVVCRLLMAPGAGPVNECQKGTSPESSPSATVSCVDACPGPLPFLWSPWNQELVLNPRSRPMLLLTGCCKNKAYVFTSFSFLYSSTVVSNGIIFILFMHNMLGN